MRTLAELYRQGYSPNLMNKVCIEVQGVLGVSRSGFRRSAVWVGGKAVVKNSWLVHSCPNAILMSHCAATHYFFSCVTHMSNSFLLYNWPFIVGGRQDNPPCFFIPEWLEGSLPFKRGRAVYFSFLRANEGIALTHSSFHMLKEIISISSNQIANTS